MNLRSRVAACAALACLAACASPPQPKPVAELAPPQWQAPLPHNGSRTDLAAWWQQQGDAMLADLIAQAQEASPDNGAARARLEQARATRTAAGAALLPGLDAQVSSSRSNLQLGLPQAATTTQAGLQAAWEIDLFGANRNTRNAAVARLDGAQAGWYAARVSVAAEVATTYAELRTCERLRLVTAQDAKSRQETSRLAQLSAQAGFLAPANAALARASAAEANSRAVQQALQCDNAIKALVVLSAMPEPQLRARLAAESAAGIFAGASAKDGGAGFTIASIPAEVLRQRPDLYIAEREVAAASYEVGAADAARYPRLSVAGSVGVGRIHTAGSGTNSDTWTIGPVALSVPIFHAGTLRANLEAARARYDSAQLQYRASVRQAVREVEMALLILQGSTTRAADTEIAAQGYRASFEATESRYRTGLGSLVELEEARRTRLAAEIAQVTLEQERMLAWIALYRAAGGGWTGPAQAQP
ncbi:MAG TPA: efflux transporter outer membrane subunit [Burkholderiaceae bacterium]